MIIVRRVCQVCCIRSCCCCCCNLLQNAITKRYQQRLRLWQEQLHIFQLQLQLGVITVRVTLGLMLMHSEQIAASAQLFSRFTCSAGGGAVRDSYREGGGGEVTVFIHVYRLQRIQFSCFLRCAARHNTLAKKSQARRDKKRERAKGREREREVGDS